MKRIAIFVIILVSLLSAQNGVTVNQSAGPEPDASTMLYFYDGSNNLVNTCKTWALQPRFYWSRSNSTLTSIVDSSNTSTITTSTDHGLAVKNLVTITGASVDADLNGTYVIQTVGSSTTFTITTASVTDATYTESSLQVSTTAPRTTADIWEIKEYTIASSLVTASRTSEGRAKFDSICGNRAVTTGSTKVSFQ